MPDIYETIYKKLYRLIPQLDRIKTASKAKTSSFMDLNLDILDDTKDYKIIALSHYYKHPSGDMIPDPDMTIRIHKANKTAEALTYQDLYRYDQVYAEQEQLVNKKLKRQLNQFLDSWLSNLLDQGHKFPEK